MHANDVYIGHHIRIYMYICVHDKMGTVRCMLMCAYIDTKLTMLV